MKQKQVTQYKCDFCTKKLYVKGAMVRHENWCVKNPINYRACYDGCMHLTTNRLLLEEGLHHDRYAENAPFCTKMMKFLLSVQAIKKQLPERYPETFEGHIPMPAKCEHYVCGYIPLQADTKLP